MQKVSAEIPTKEKISFAVRISLAISLTAVIVTGGGLMFLALIQPSAVVVSPESICPGGSNPRSDVIWCADFDRLTQCPVGNEFNCWKDNIEAFGGTMNDWPTGSTLQYGMRIVPSGGTQGQAAVGNGFVHGPARPGGNGAGYSRIFPPQQSNVYNLRYYIRFGGQNGKGYMSYYGPHGSGILGAGTKSDGSYCGVGGTLEESQSGPYYYISQSCLPGQNQSDNLPVNMPGFTPRQNGRWYLVEQQRVADTACTNLNDPYGCNGILRVWVDGQLVIEYTNLNWSNGSGTIKWNELWGPRVYYHSRFPSWGSVIDFDNYVVSTKDPSTCPNGKGPCIGAAANENPRGTADPSSPYYNYVGIEPFYGRAPASDCTSPGVIGTPNFNWWYPYAEGNLNPWFQQTGLSFPNDSTIFYPNGFQDYCPIQSPGTYSPLPEKSFTVKLTKTNFRGGIFAERAIPSTGYVFPQQVIRSKIYIPAGNDFAANPALSGFATYESGIQWGKYVALTVNNGKFAIVRRNALSSAQAIIATSNASVQFNAWQDFELIIWNDGTASLMIDGTKVIPKTPTGMPANWFFESGFVGEPKIVIGVIDFQGTASATNPFTIHYDDLQVGTASFWSCDGWGTSCPFAIVGPDTFAPTVPTGLTATAVSPSQINLTWNISTDNVAVLGYKVYRNGTEAGSTGTTTLSNTGLTANTAYTYAVAAYDAAGNVSAQSATVSATTPAPAGDTQAPDVSLTNPQDKATVAGTINMVATATDNVAVAKVQFFVDGNVYGNIYTPPYSHPLLSATFPDGPHIIKATAFDTSNNATSSSLTVTIQNTTVDTIAPTIPTGLSSTAVYANEIDLTWDPSTDTTGVTGYRLYRGGTALTTTTGTAFQDTGLASGTTYQYAVSAYDAAGNESAKSATLTVATAAIPVDTTPPTVGIYNPPAGSTLSHTVTFSAGAVDNESGISRLSLLVDGTIVKTCLNSMFCRVKFNSGKLAPGAHTLTAEAVDRSPAANTASKSITVYR